MDNPDLAYELKQRNLRFAHTRSWDKVASQFCTLYNKMMDETSNEDFDDFT
jgi:hypothetical protein